jgi:signal transduction histidine kinase
MRMDELILDLLNLGRLSHIEVDLHRTNLNLVMERVLHEAAYPKKTKAAEVIISGPLPPVWAVENLAGQVLFNLLENALKFVPPGRRPRIHIFAEERESMVRLCFQDNGIGVESEYYERIFGVFEQLHGDAYEGTGIGLAIVKQSMNRMRGRVGLESHPGEGSKFWVEFPPVPKST